MKLTVQYHDGVRFEFSPDEQGRQAVMAAVQREAQKQIEYAAESEERRKRYESEMKATNKKKGR